MTKNFLANLNGDDPASVARAMQSLSAKIRNSPVLDGDNENVETDDNNYMENFSNDAQLGNLERDRLASFEQWSDENLLPELLDKINSGIYDFSSATLALEAYNINWFRQQPLSNSGKQQVAGTILRLVQQYSKAINNFWQALVDNDTQALAEVSFNIVRAEDKDFTQ